MAHAGFLAEALVEAVPQSVLQTCALVALGRATPLNVFSIVIAVLVIASKVLYGDDVAYKEMSPL